MNIKKVEQLQLYESVVLAHTVELGPNETWVCCPNCPYREIRETSNDPLFIFCRGEVCGKQYCYWCFKEVTPESIDEYQDDNMDDDEMENHEISKHMACWEFGPLKKKVEAIIQDNMKRFCPNPECGLTGRKDDNCTHMSCPQCHTEWCYICGDSLPCLNKAANNESIYGHNTNWFANAKRCPMYLSQVHDIDESWPVADEDALNYFHHILTIRALSKEIANTKVDEIKNLLRIYPQVLGGYTLQQILEFDYEKPLYPLSEEHELDPSDDESAEESDEE